MKKLYTTQASNSYQSLLIDDIREWVPLRSIIHKSARAEETQIKFHFELTNKKAAKIPDICTVYNSGIIAFSIELINLILPNSHIAIELIPIQVNGKPWVILSCLQSAIDIDIENSQIMRGLSGEIFSITKIRVTDTKARDWEMFTIDGSNRTQLFVTESFRDRIEKSKLKGITFKEIGEIV